ncbi:hypothetical protein [Salmonella enterica]|uniref:hypothetical protein n=1 Tax=Salmonella enterica TaxID=28901 RepID=UPI001EE66D55|nr:hypothetical protein [Salmonella enterica]
MSFRLIRLFSVWPMTYSGNPRSCNPDLSPTIQNLCFTPAVAVGGAVIIQEVMVVVVVVVAVIIQEVTVVAVTVVAINGILLLISDFSFLNSQAIYHHTF